MSALTIQNLSKTYPQQVLALQGINLTVAKGDFFALLGPNGAGKSTTIGIICSLVNKTAGQVKVFGFDLDKQIEQVKSHIGLVPQEFNFNIFEPINQVLFNQAGYYGIPRALAKENIEYYLNKLGLWEKRLQPGMRLSGGMKRRLMIARALVHNPQLLILDEPTAGVDIELRYTLWEFFKELNQQGTTIILTTHYLEEAESLCKNIAIIDQGHIIADTSMKELLRRLDTETFILYARHPITQLPASTLNKYYLVDETTLEVAIKKGQDLNTVFYDLNQNHIHITSMRNKTNRLETLFMELTRKSKPLPEQAHDA
jgi:ABC-2 type transport system ATP-binding protein